MILKIPLFGTIPRSGNEWIISLQEQKTETGSTINGSISGYGPFPYEKYPGIPVIDFTGESIDRCLQALKIHDRIKPKMGYGTVQEFIQAHKDLGFKVIEPDPTNEKCPACGGILEGDSDLFFTDKTVSQDCQCNACGKTFRHLYRLSEVEELK